MSLEDPFSVPFSQPTNFEINSNAQGEINTPAPLYEVGTTLSFKTPIFIPRLNTPTINPNPLNTAGIPGTNFVSGSQSTPVFYQGEDVVYDSYLYINGQSINLNIFNLYATVKSSPYLVTNSWTGNLGNGIYNDNTDTNHYIIFIPNSVTSTLIAGTFELDIYAVEDVNQNMTIKPRTILVGKTYFNIEYAAFSPNPESIEEGAPNLRQNLPNSYPPPFNTVGGNNFADDGSEEIPFI